MAAPSAMQRVFDRSYLVENIGESLAPLQTMYSLNGLNIVCHAFAQRVKSENKLEQPLHFWQLFLERQMPIPRLRGSMISGWESKTSEIYSIEVFPYGRYENESKTLCGRTAVYFNRDGTGGLTVYDDVVSQYPIRLPFKKYGQLHVTKVGTYKRWMKIDTSDVTTDNVSAEALGARLVDNDIGLDVGPFTVDYFSDGGSNYLDGNCTYYQIMTASKNVVGSAVKRDEIAVACTIVRISCDTVSSPPFIVVENNSKWGYNASSMYGGFPRPSDIIACKKLFQYEEDMRMSTE